MKKFMLIFACIIASIGLSVAQTTQATGKVIDDTGEAVIGASVVAKGTTVGVITGIDGEFKLNVPNDAKTLVISLIGYKQQEVAVGTNLRIKLETDSKLIDEVVVTAIGIERPERSLGYTMSIVDADDAVQKAEPDLLRSLDGKIPGVQVTAPSGVAGSATRITIRGNSSFFGNNQPLYVVDGVPYSNTELSTTNQASQAGGAYGSGISTLDPNDIESMNVLKGAAASALYGSRAANGVVLITTKSGSKNKKSKGKGLEVALNASYTIEKVTALPNYQNSFGGGTYFKAAGSNGSWGASFQDVTEIPLNDYNRDYLKYYPNLPEVVPYKAYKNNVKDLFDTGGIYDISTNINSYNERGNFSVTLSKMDQDSYIPHSDFYRNAVSVGGNQKLANNLRVGGNVSFSRTKQNGPMFGNNQSSGIGASSFARALVLGRSWDMSLPYETPTGGSLFFVGSQADNPLWSWKYNKTTTTMDRTVANFNFGYDVTQDLSIDYSVGINDFKMDRLEVLNLGSRALGGNGRIVTDNYKSQEIESTLLIRYKKKLNEEFSLSTFIGQNINQFTTERSREVGLNIMAPGIYNIDNTLSQTAESTYSRSRLAAILGEVSLSYNNYAFLTFTGRNDWSSTLPKDNRSYFYPSVSGSFVFTDAFKMNDDILSFGKIRLSWAKVGNDGSPYYTNGRYNIGRPYDGAPQLTALTTKYNPNLKPEFTKEFEFGTELQFFRGKANIDFTYYNRNSTDQIAPLSLPYSTGYGSYMTNFGKINNRGIELGVTLVPISTRDFKWDLFWNYSRNKSEIKELTDGVDRVSLGTAFSTPAAVMVKGKPYGALYGTGIARDENGNRLVDPASGMYLIADEERYLGDPAPMYRTSLSNTFSYKGISLSFMFDAQVKGSIYTTYVADLLGRGVTKDTEDRYGSRILPGVLADPATKKPILDANGNTIPNNTQISEMDLWFSDSGLTTFAINGVNEVQTYDATTIRLRELNIGYEFPKKWLAKTIFGSASVSFVARNLWVYAPNLPKHTKYDPTVAGSYGGGNIQGIDYTSAPNTKRYGFNFKLTF